MRSLHTLAVVSLVSVALAACDKPAAEQPLPPSGLAGVGAQGAAGGAAMPAGALPGVGMPGASASASGLPAGHPPIGQPTMAAPAGNPMDHSNQPMVPAAPHGGAGGAAALGLPGAGGSPTAPGAGVTINGTVAEAMDVTEYTYMRLTVKGATDEWVAVPKAPIKVGDVVTVSQSIVMNNFPSKSLNRTFDKLTMGMLVGAPQRAN